MQIDDDSIPPLLSDDEFEQHSLELHTERAPKGLFRSLHGVDLDNQSGQDSIEALIVTNNYKTTPEGALWQFEEGDQLEGDGDCGLTRKLFGRNGFPDRKVKVLANKLATRDNIMDAGPHLDNTSVTVIQGHTRYILPEDPTVEGQGTQCVSAPTIILLQNLITPNPVMTQDFFTHNPPQGLTCSDLFEMFLPRNNGPTRRLVLTDTCYNYNFNELQYRLEVNPRSSPDWVESPDWDEGFSRPESDILMHFAAGSPHQPVHETIGIGGFFTNGFCRAMKIRRTLPDLLETVRNDIELHGKLQAPQIYSSYDFDLDDVDVMKTFGFFRELASCT